MRDPNYNPKDAATLKAQNAGQPCPSCGSTSGHTIKCETLNSGRPTTIKTTHGVNWENRYSTPQTDFIKRF